MTSCIFCKIANGELPSEKVYEDEKVLAFMDISPVSKGHTLIIPKHHAENVYELNEETAAHLFSIVPKVANALNDTFHPQGLNLLQNNGSFAGQSVFHFHLHLIPRYEENDGLTLGWDPQVDVYDAEAVQQFAEQVRTTLR